MRLDRRVPLTCLTCVASAQLPGGASAADSSLLTSAVTSTPSSSSPPVSGHLSQSSAYLSQSSSYRYTNSTSTPHTSVSGTATGTTTAKTSIHQTESASVSTSASAMPLVMPDLELKGVTPPSESKTSTSLTSASSANSPGVSGHPTPMTLDATGPYANSTGATITSGVAMNTDGPKTQVGIIGYTTITIQPQDHHPDNGKAPNKDVTVMPISRSYVVYSSIINGQPTPVTSWIAAGVTGNSNGTHLLLGDKVPTLAVAVAGLAVPAETGSTAAAPANTKTTALADAIPAAISSVVSNVVNPAADILRVAADQIKQNAITSSVPVETSQAAVEQSQPAVEEPAPEATTQSKTATVKASTTPTRQVQSVAAVTNTRAQPVVILNPEQSEVDLATIAQPTVPTAMIQADSKNVAPIVPTALGIVAVSTSQQSTPTTRVAMEEVVKHAAAVDNGQSAIDNGQSSSVDDTPAQAIPAKDAQSTTIVPVNPGVTTQPVAVAASVPAANVLASIFRAAANEVVSSGPNNVVAGQNPPAADKTPAASVAPVSKAPAPAPTAAVVVGTQTLQLSSTITLGASLLNLVTDAAGATAIVQDGTRTVPLTSFLAQNPVASTVLVDAVANTAVTVGGVTVQPAVPTGPAAAVATDSSAAVVGNSAIVVGGTVTLVPGQAMTMTRIDASATATETVVYESDGRLVVQGPDGTASTTSLGPAFFGSSSLSVTSPSASSGTDTDTDGSHTGTIVTGTMAGTGVNDSALPSMTGSDPPFTGSGYSGRFDGHGRRRVLHVAAAAVLAFVIGVVLA